MSGKVVPGSNIYLRTAPSAASNSIFQVFGTPSGSNLAGLVGCNYNTSARPPPFYSTDIVPTAASGNLKVSFFAGKSKFLTVPNTPTITTMTTSNFTPSLSGGGGSSYYIAVGNNFGGFENFGWAAASSGTSYTVSVPKLFVSGSNYYISAYSSNVDGSSSLAFANLNAFGIPNAPTGTVTFAITAANALLNWTINGWGAPASGIQPTQYSYTLLSNGSTVQSGILTGPPYTDSHNFTPNVNYSVRIYSYRPEAALNFITSTLGLPLDIPGGFSISSVSRSQANLSWTAVAGANSYSVRYRVGAGSFTSINVGNVTSYAFSIANGYYDVSVFANYSAAGYTASTSDYSAVKRVYRYDTTQTNITVQTNTYTVVVAGGGGGSASGYAINAGGGGGGTLQKSISLSSASFINFTPGAAGGASAGGYFSVFNYAGGSTILAPAGGGGGAGVANYTGDGGSAGGGGEGGSAGGGANASQFVEFYPDGYGEGGYYPNTIYANASGGDAGNTTSDVSAPVAGSSGGGGFFINWILGGGGRGYLFNGSRGTPSGEVVQDVYGSYFRTVAAGGGGGGANYANVGTNTVTSSLGAGGAGGILIMYT